MKKYNYKRVGLLLALPFFLTGCSATSTKSYSVDSYRRTLQYHDDFKIMQLTDLHFSVQTDYVSVTNYLANNINTANPNLIVITGDSFMDASEDAVDNVLDFFDSFNIPFAFTYGNHDHQGNYGYYYINDYIKTLKNAVFVDYDDDNITGLTNYFIDLVDNGSTVYRLYIIDSGSYYFTGVKYGYDIIHEDQIVHMEDIAKKYEVVPSLAFYHIPLYEEDDAFKAVKAGTIQTYKHTNYEKVSYGYKRTDAFSRMKNIGVVGHFFGHDHINYTDILYQGVTLSYGVKSTPEIYNYDDILGYKEITLKRGDWSIDNIEAKVVSYERS